MTRQARARKLRYRNDPEFRAVCCARVRESYEARLAHAERLFAQLTALIAEREQLAAERKARKNLTRRAA